MKSWKQSGSNDGHGRDINLNTGKTEAESSASASRSLIKTKPLALPPERAGTDPRKAKGSIQEVPVECRKVGS